MKTIKKIIAAITLTTLFAGAFSGCATNDEKETVSIALWGNQLLEAYAPWLQEQFPDVDFNFSVVNNSTDYYKFRKESDELPDIMTIRRFSLRDVQALKDDLMDLSDTELAGTFYQSYLRNYTYSDGTINWLPACAEIDDIIVNKTLFDENNIPLPTDWESFKNACAEFEKLGIKGYVTDFNMDYTCMETLQGFSISQFTSSEGREWRQNYESGLTDEPDREVWLPAFEKMMSFIECTGVNEDNFSLDATDIMNAFDRGEIAMYRGTGADLINYGKDYERVMMPIPGNTEEESWYLTYPAFQLAANKNAEESEDRTKLITDIMTAMLSEDGLSHISEGRNMVAYNKDISLELIPELSNLSEYISDNRIYIRLASSEMFSVSQDVVQRMIKGEITTAEQAYEEFKNEMTTDTSSDAEEDIHILEAYSADFNPDGGSEAASAVYNTLRNILNADCMLGSSTIVTGDIPTGNYSSKEMKLLFNGSDGFLLKMNLTGDRLKELVQYMLDVKGSRDSVAGNSTLPASSGFEMNLEKTDSGYKVKNITIDGSAPEDGETYSVILRVRYEPDIKGIETAGFDDYEVLDKSVMTMLTDKLKSDGTLDDATKYLTLSE